MASTREFSEQFGAGADISPLRMESAVDDLLTILNDVTPRFQIRRFVETHLVAGYSPSRVATPQSLPWMRAYNSPSTAGSSLELPTTFENPYRFKLAWEPPIFPEVPNLVDGDLYTWEISFHAPRDIPSILGNVAVWLAVDDTYVNIFEYGVEPPPGKESGAPINDLTIQLLVDSDLETENRAKTAVEACLYQSNLDAHFISLNTVDPLWDTMQPPYPGTTVQGVCAEVLAARVIPAGSRVRLLITIPAWVAFGEGGFDADYPWQSQVWSVNIQLLTPSER